MKLTQHFDCWSILLAAFIAFIAWALYTLAILANTDRRPERYKALYPWPPKPTHRQQDALFPLPQKQPAFRNEPVRLRWMPGVQPSDFILLPLSAWEPSKGVLL